VTKLSIILPCYDEGTSISQLIADYRKCFADINDIELIIVNNGSSDKTAEYLALEEQRSNPFELKIVTIPHNIGFGFGVLSGIMQASGEFLAWSHSDLQCSPEDVLRLFNLVMEHPDPKCCFGKGCRVNARGVAAVFTFLHTLLASIILCCRFREINAQPKLFHRKFIETFKSPPIGYELDIYAYYKAKKQNLAIVTVDVIFLERKTGKSHWAYSISSRIRFVIKSFLYLFKLRFFAKHI
jgi:glycosyltransferase involved in cell wall biosynthesis